MSLAVPMLLAMVGCQEAPPPEPTPHRLVAQDATFTVEAHGLVVHARQATLGDDGSGHAQTVTADAPGLQISSTHSQWRFDERTATFTGSVVATRDDATLHCDRLSVVLGTGEQIQSAQATGNVIVTQADRRAVSSQATLDGASGQVVLTGQPSLTQDGRTLSGDAITIWLDDERVDCTQCTLTLSGDAIGGG